MTLEEARVIWLTMLGSDWVPIIEILESPHYEATLGPAYRELRMRDEIEVNHVREIVRIKCKS